jgi:hypothetical protein
MAKKKVFKTGGIYDGDPNTGFLLGERLKNYKKSEIELIKKQYDKILENLEKEIGNTTNSIEKQKKFELENKKQLSNEDQFQKTNETKINIANSKLNKDYINLIVKFLFKTINIFKSLLYGAYKLFITFINTFIKFFNIGEGSVARFILFVIMMVMILGGIAYGIISLTSLSKNMKNNDAVVKDIIHKDNDDYLKSPIVDTSYLSYIYNWFANLIPDTYKYQVNNAKNSIHYIMTGSNQYDIYATPRPDNKDDGRCDNIFHINFSSNVDSYKPDSTYSILKPNNIRLEYNYNYNTDYQFIGKFAEDYFATSSNYIIDIPITTENGKYILGDNSLIARKNDQYIFKSFPNKKYIINKDISGSYLNGIYNSEHLQTIINNKYTPSDLLYNFKSNIKNINDKTTKNSMIYNFKNNIDKINSNYLII